MNFFERPRKSWAMILLILLVVSVSTDALATHFRYGHITWTRVSDNTVRFKVTTAWRSTFVSHPYLYFGDGDYGRGDSTHVFVGSDLSGESYTITEYTIDHTYSGEGPYTAYIVSCCRISTLVNAANSYWRVGTTVDLRNGNSGSPVSSIPVILQLEHGRENVIPIPVADPDGDEFTLRMASYWESYVWSLPSAGLHTVGVDSDANLVWNTESTSVGEKYAVQVAIDENHNGNISTVALDFIIEIVDPANNTPPVVETETQGLQLITPGNPITATFTGVDSAGGNLTVSTLGAPANAVLKPPSGSTAPSPLVCTFEWTPAPGDTGNAYAMTVIFQNEAGYQSLAPFSIQVTPNDDDGDGVANSLDAYPHDSTRAFNNYFPGIGTFGTLAFEDLWPQKGDYDFNDLVIDYRFNQITNANNEVVEIVADIVSRAAGGIFENGFGIQLPILTSEVSSVTGHNVSNEYITLDNSGLESGQSKATVIVFDNIQHILTGSGSAFVNTRADDDWVTPDTISVRIQLTDPMTLAALGSPPYNPFLIINKERGREVHLINQLPTDLANTALFGTEDDASNPAQGRYYQTSTHLPWAINLPDRWDYPVEKIDIIQAHLKFVIWATTSGTTFQDWHLDIPGYRETDNIFTRP